jgi:anaerobic selenocysteine-containing dehydrogenase
VLADAGLDPVPDFIAPHESVQSNPERAAHFPLAILSPPARHFLNSSFVNVRSLRDIEGTPTLHIHPADAAPRAIVDGARVRAYNDRGELALTACVSDRTRPGVVVAPSIWWRKLAPDGKNANELTHQHLTDLGAAPCFYDCLVQVEAHT